METAYGKQMGLRQFRSPLRVKTSTQEEIAAWLACHAAGNDFLAPWPAPEEKE